MNPHNLNSIDKDFFREQLLQYTKKAFLKLPKMENPKILDVGCGSGVPTLELARLSGGEIVAVDSDQNMLDHLNHKIKEHKLEFRVKTIKCSLFKLDFPPKTFDILWAEGSIYAIGFEKGLREWRPLIKDHDYLVVHDECRDHHEKLRVIKSCGYRLLDSFVIPHQVWWSDYYQPLEKHLQKLETQYKDNLKILEALKNEKKEIKMFKEDPEAYSSIFYVMQKV